MERKRHGRVTILFVCLFVCLFGGYRQSMLRRLPPSSKDLVEQMLSHISPQTGDLFLKNRNGVLCELLHASVKCGITSDNYHVNELIGTLLHRIEQEMQNAPTQQDTTDNVVLYLLHYHSFDNNSNNSNNSNNNNNNNNNNDANPKAKQVLSQLLPLSSRYSTVGCLLLQALIKTPSDQWSKGIQQKFYLSLPFLLIQ
ncbi:SH2 domain-containing protein [Reticulomyxa filosa]|uniref:SH2 domain-containing protein n=1 Tax=Reticulomyxa filosa TaxID=46433 RepID=X6N4I5_RETFI|nr:SH2 domain-containing protein [Reticulomyxa filosa]|eukprot:ETO20901.1 SH2 domain-containing protein [Reticulomyxa filosa]